MAPAAREVEERPRVSVQAGAPVPETEQVSVPEVVLLLAVVQAQEQDAKVREQGVVQALLVVGLVPLVAEEAVAAMPGNRLLAGHPEDKP